jgi:hypothetical protein
VRHRDQLGERIKHWFDTTVRDTLTAAGFVNYVIDFGVMEKKMPNTGTIGGRGVQAETLDIDRICVIELNPWGSSTDRYNYICCLFPLHCTPLLNFQ